MKNRAFFILFVLLSALSLWGQELAINPLELALSGVVTVAVLDTEGEDQVLGYTGARKSYADIAYEEALDMSSAFSNGSGFVIEYEGSYYVLTNVHVIDAASGKPGSIKAYSITRDEYPMKVVGGDSFYDLAILAFDGKQPGEEIHPLSFSGQEVELAQKAYAIGNPLGQYPYTITEGIISGKNRLFFRPTTGRFGCRAAAASTPSPSRRRASRQSRSCGRPAAKKAASSARRKLSSCTARGAPCSPMASK